MSTWKTQGLFLLRTLCIGLGLLGLALPTLGQTPTFTVLHSFGHGKDGAYPTAGLVQGADGFFYGTTEEGGAGYYPLGTVFRLTSAGGEKVLCSFSYNGIYPNASLIQGADGNFYGTTRLANLDIWPPGGSVFRVTPAGQVTWLHYFDDYSSDGAYPETQLVQGTDGNFYGITPNGGTDGDLGNGTIFKVTPDGQETVLYAFGEDESSPGTLIQAADGNFYGTAGGTVFQLTPGGALSVFYPFVGGSASGLIQGADGSFYGITSLGGAYNSGTVFQLTPSATFNVLYSFKGGADGSHPNCLMQGYDAFYGTTKLGGPYGNGTVFRLTPAGAETVLYSFTGSSDGRLPNGVIHGYDGSFYGTTEFGGTYNAGTAFRLSGVYVLPLISISPGACNAGGPAFTLTAKGTGFQPFTTVCWNGSPLATTFVSSSAVKATIPASLIATPGTARITVVTGGGPSNAKNVTIKLTTLKLASATLIKNSTTGAYTASIGLQNIGYQTAPQAMVTKATLGTATTSTTLPVMLGAIAASSTGNAALVFPASAGTSGTIVVLKVSGTFTGGSFSGTLKVKLP